MLLLDCCQRSKKYRIHEILPNYTCTVKVWHSRKLVSAARHAPFYKNITVCQFLTRKCNVTHNYPPY